MSRKTTMQTLVFYLSMTLLLLSPRRFVVQGFLFRPLLSLRFPCRTLVSVIHQGSSHEHDTEHPLTLARKAFSHLAKTDKSWKRLGHLVELGCSIKAPISSIADIGCDHGLLTVGLAVSGKFSRVIGADVSPLALENALSLHRDLRARPDLDLNVEFRLGDGMAALGDNEIDVVCLAGMGVVTMKGILSGKELDRVGCQHILIQPTNSRPRHLCQLYHYLLDMGWGLCDEKIEYLSGRWYVSSLFSRNEAIVPAFSTCRYSTNTLPGAFLESLDSCDLMAHKYKSYVDHHISWIMKDMQVTSISEEEQRWLSKAKEYVFHNQQI